MILMSGNELAYVPNSSIVATQLMPDSEEVSMRIPIPTGTQIGNDTSNLYTI